MNIDEQPRSLGKAQRAQRMSRGGVGHVATRLCPTYRFFKQDNTA